MVTNMKSLCQHFDIAESILKYRINVSLVWSTTIGTSSGSNSYRERMPLVDDLKAFDCTKTKTNVSIYIGVEGKPQDRSRVGCKKDKDGGGDGSLSTRGLTSEWYFGAG